MAYIGREPQTGNYQICDAISVVNGQAAYTMQVSSTNVIPESVNHMIVSLNGVIQKPGSSYTIASSTITFSSNLATGDSIDFIYLLGNVLDLGTPSDSTVTTAKLSGNLVTPGTLDVNGQELILDADADTSITADTDDQIDIKVAGADDFQITANTLTALSGSTIKADTIAETTGANGVAVDGLTIKDGKLNTDDSVVTANITDANVTSAKLASDAVTTAKITDANVTSAKIAGDAITAAKIADDAISEEHLDVTAITGHTAETSIADGDTLLIHDASASALRKMTKANFVSGIGGSNSVRWFASKTSDQSFSENTKTQIQFSNEIIDVGTCYDNSNYMFTVPSGEGGTYMFGVGGWTYDQSESIAKSELYVVHTPSGGSENDAFFQSIDVGSATSQRVAHHISGIMALNAGDTLHVAVYASTDDDGDIIWSGSGHAARFRSYFWGYKLIT